MYTGLRDGLCMVHEINNSLSCVTVTLIESNTCVTVLAYPCKFVPFLKFQSRHFVAIALIMLKFCTIVALMGLHISINNIVLHS